MSVPCRAPWAFVALLALTGAGAGSCRRSAASRAPTGPPAPTQERLLADADVRRRSGDLEGSIAVYAALRERTPKDVRAHLGYVRALSEAGRRSEAREDYQRRSLAPSASEVERVLAQRLASDQSSSALRSIYEHASAREAASPWWPLGLAEVELSEADAWVRRRAQARDAGDREGETRAHAQARGALTRADRALERASTLAGAEIEVELYRGYVRSVEGDLAAGQAARQAAYRAAAASFERATTAAPEHLEAWMGLADAQARLGEQGESLEAWMRAVRLAPSFPYARLELARTLGDIGRTQDAVLQYRELAALEPRSAEPWLRIGDAWGEEERWHEAARAYREALVRDATAIEALARLGGVLEQQGDTPGAREAYQRYIEQGGERKEAIERRLERLVAGERSR